MAARIALGMEISDTEVIIARIEDQFNDPVIQEITTVQLPENVVVHGDIQDADTLAELVTQSIKEWNVGVVNVVVGLSQVPFLKITERFPIMPMEDLRAEINTRLSNAPFFSGKEFQSGLMVPPAFRSGDQWNPPVLYAGIMKSIVDSVQDFVALSGFNLVAIDIVPFSLLRVLTWKQWLHQDHVLSIVIEDDYMDLGILLGGSLVHTYCVRRPFKKLSMDTEYVTEILARINQFLLSYGNSFPGGEVLDKCVLFSRLSLPNEWIEAFKQEYDELEFVEYSLFSNLSFSEKQFDTDRTFDVIRGSVAVGLGLKYFEPLDQSLNLTKVKKSFGPIVNRRQFMVSLGLLVAGVLAVVGLNIVMNVSLSKIDKGIVFHKKEIQSLQTGEFLLRQKRLDTVRKNIKTMADFREDPYAKIPFFANIIRILPDEVSFSKFVMDKNRRVTIQGNSISQDAIYVFYNYLKAHYSNVTISNIKIDYSGEYPVNQFDLQFDWGKN